MEGKNKRKGSRKTKVDKNNREDGAERRANQFSSRGRKNRGKKTWDHERKKRIAGEESGGQATERGEELKSRKEVMDVPAGGKKALRRDSARPKKKKKGGKRGDFLLRREAGGMWVPKNEKGGRGIGRVVREESDISSPVGKRNQGKG